MPEEFKAGCARPTGSLVGEDIKPQLDPVSGKGEEKKGKEGTRMIKDGKKAPDFTAPAYLKGKFVNVRLSEYLGKWVVLCFYPGDFTFV